MKINYKLQPNTFLESLERFWSFSGEKIRNIENEYDLRNGFRLVSIKKKL